MALINVRCCCIWEMAFHSFPMLFNLQKQEPFSTTSLGNSNQIHILTWRERLRAMEEMEGERERESDKQREKRRQREKK